MFERHFFPHSMGCGCGCGKVCNSYRHSRPKKKEMLFMDTTLIEDFTVRRIKEGEVKQCERVCADVAIENSCIILSTQTPCLDYDVEYTLDLPRAIDWNAKQVFIKAEPCRFVRGALELEKTVVTVPFCEFPFLKLTAENLPGFYRAKFDRCECEKHEKCECEEREHEHKRRMATFIEVDLDLRGNIVTTNKLLQNGYGRCGDRDKYILYFNNAGRLVLERDRCRTRRFGDF